MFNPLEQKIIEKIKCEGPITFETFMNIALYDLEHGYYSSGKHRIGKKGDFFTSPYVSKIFGFMLGKQVEEMWEIMDKPDNFTILEIGAEEGYMCKDIIEYLSYKNILDSFEFIIVEPSIMMQDKQNNLLKSYTKYIKWVTDLDHISNITGCIITNELLDAFPVHLIEMKDNLYEIYVNFNGTKFFEVHGKLSDKRIKEYIDEFSINLPDNYRTEINLKIKDWIKSINKVLDNGFIITIDYGFTTTDYYAPERNKGTLLCYFKHTVNEDPYKNIGHQDITAHINFSSLKKWAEDLGLKTIGFCQQGVYLVSLGIDEIINEFLIPSKEYISEIAKIKNLILPGTLGETHKVLIQYKGNLNPKLRGFNIRNQKERL